MSSPNGQTPAARLRALERSIPAPSCETCEGRRLRIVFDDAPAPETCPTCGQAIQVIRIRERQDGPQ